MHVYYMLAEPRANRLTMLLILDVVHTNIQEYNNFSVVTPIEQR